MPCRPCGVSKIAKIFSDAKKTPDLMSATRLRSTPSVLKNKKQKMEILDKKNTQNKRCKRSMSFEDFLKIAWSSLIMESSVHAFDPKTKQSHAQIGPHRCDQMHFLWNFRVSIAKSSNISPAAAGKIGWPQAQIRAMCITGGNSDYFQTGAGDFNLDRRLVQTSTAKPGPAGFWACL